MVRSSLACAVACILNISFAQVAGAAAGSDALHDSGQRSEADVPKQRLQLSINCIVVDPAGRQGHIELSVDEYSSPKGRIILSTINLQDYLVNQIAPIPQKAENSPVVREFQVDAPLGPLNLRLIGSGTEWSVELAPAEWSALSGPLATGRCSNAPQARTELAPMTGQPVKYPITAPVDIVPWSFGEVTKECRIVDSDGVGKSRLTVGEGGKFKYIDRDSVQFSGSIETALVSSEYGHTTVHRRMNLSSGDNGLVLSFFYRQGRFWIDGKREFRNGLRRWFRGVCISSPPA